VTAELDAALSAWRETRAASDAERVEALGDVALRSYEGLRARAKDAFHAAWLELAASDKGALATGWLASTITVRLPVAAERLGIIQPNYAQEKYAALAERIAVMRSKGPDPRIGRVLTALVEEAPFSVWDDAGTMTIYRPIVEALVAAGDPRAIAPLERLLAAPRARKNVIRVALGRLLPEAVESLRAIRITLAHAEPMRPVEATRTSAADGDELLARVHAAPEDDAARLVYADWLTERGDARGELITLQVLEASGQATDAQRTRVRSLVRKHKDAWLGPRLAAVLRGVEFERGFLAVAELAQNASATLDAWKEASADPALATLRVLEQGRGNAQHYRTFITSPAARSLARIEIPLPSFLEALLEDDAIYPFTHLVFRRPPQRKLCARLVDARSLPRVTGVTIPLSSEVQKRGGKARITAEIDEILANLTAAKLLPRLRGLGLFSSSDPHGVMATLLERFPEFPISIERFEVAYAYDRGGASIARSAEGLRMHLRGYFADGASSLVRDAPEGLNDVQADPTRLTEYGRTQLEREAKARGVRLVIA
jgi:uncharacterized protein (TIGR02996 family)